MTTDRAENTNEEAQKIEAQPDGELLKFPVIQEEITVDKQVVETGKVRISKRISEHEEMVDIPILREEVAVERIPVNQYVDAHPQVRQEGDTMIIPVVHEQLVMQKRLLLVEELRVRKQIVEAHQPQKVTLRKEEVRIDRTATNEHLNTSDKGD